MRMTHICSTGKLPLLVLAQVKVLTAPCLVGTVEEDSNNINNLFRILRKRKSHLCIPRKDIALLQSQFPHSWVCELFIYSKDVSTDFPAACRIGRPILEIYKSLTDIWVYRNWKIANYNSVLEITVSFLGIQNWEPDIFIGFSLTLHLQCTHYSVTAPFTWVTSFILPTLPLSFESFLSGWSPTGGGGGQEGRLRYTLFPGLRTQTKTLSGRLGSV